MASRSENAFSGACIISLYDEKNSSYNTYTYTLYVYVLYELFFIDNAVRLLFM